jgi:hypothetical protein
MLRRASFGSVPYGRGWAEWPGIMLPVATVFALWLAVIVGVLRPLEEALARLQADVSVQVAADRGLADEVGPTAQPQHDGVPATLVGSCCS